MLFVVIIFIQLEAPKRFEMRVKVHWTMFLNPDCHRNHAAAWLPMPSPTPGGPHTH